MKLQSYEPQVRMSQPNAPVVAAVTDPNAYGGNASGLRDLSKTIDKWSVVLDKQIDALDRTSVLQAMDAYNRGRYDIMYNEKNGLMNTRGEAAGGISQMYLDKNNDLRTKVLNSVRIRRKDNFEGLVNFMDRAGQQGLETVGRHQFQQGEQVKDAALNNNLTHIASALQRDYANPNAINEALTNAHLMISLRYGEDVGKDILDEKYRATDAQILGGVLSGAIAQSDYKGAAAMLQTYGDKLTPQQRVQYTNTLQSKGSQEHLYYLGRTAYQLFPDDEQAALEWIAKQPAFSVLDDTNTRSLDEMEIRQAQNNYLTEANTAKRIERNFIDNSITQFSEDIYKMLQENKGFNEAMSYAKEKAGSNYKLVSGYTSLVKSFYGKSANSDNHISASNKKYCEQLLREGWFNTPAEYAAQIAAMGGSATDQVNAINDYKSWRNGTGKFRYTGTQLLEIAAGNKYKNLKQDQKAIMENAVHDTVGKMIADYEIENHKEPTLQEVTKMAKDAVTFAPVPGLGDAGFFDFAFKSSPAALQMAGIANVEVKDVATNVITMTDGSRRIVTDDELRALIKNSTTLFEKLK